MATKSEELAILRETIAKLGEHSYCGPWLASVLHELEGAMGSDLAPTCSVVYREEGVRDREAHVQGRERALAERERQITGRESLAAGRERHLDGRMAEARRVLASIGA